MIGISTNADEVAERIQAKADRLVGAVQSGVRSALLAVEAAAVKNLSGSGAPYAYPVPVRTGNLRSGRTVAQPSPGVGVITFTADYAWAVHTGKVRQWAGRGKSRDVQRTARPFADDAVESAKPSDIVIAAVQKVMAI